LVDVVSNQQQVTCFNLRYRKSLVHFRSVKMLQRLEALLSPFF